MEGAETTTQTTTEAAPPAAAASTTTTETQQPAAQATATATENKTQTPSKKPTPADFFKQREEKREKKASDELAELRTKYAELEKKVSAPQPTQADDDIDLLADPQKFRTRTIDAARQAALEVFEQRERDAIYTDNANRAGDWLLSRTHLKEDPKLVDDIGAVLREKYTHIAAKDGAGDPVTAMRLAYLDVCAARGVTPDMDGFKQAAATMNATGGTATSGARASAAPSGKKVFQRGEIEAYIFGAKAGTPEYSRRKAEVDEAYNEGRVR